MEVHIKRRHRGINLALNNPYGANNARSFGYPNYNLKPSYSLNNVSNVAFYDEESIRRQTNRGDRQEDSMDHFIDLLSKQAQIKDLTSQLIPPYYPQAYLQQFYYPNTLGQFMQRTPVFSTSSFHRSSPAISMNSINISGPVSDEGNKNLSGTEVSIKPKSFQLISLRGLICDKCLTIDIIPLGLNEDGTVQEIHNHFCREDRVMNLKRRDKHDLIKFFVALHRALPKILAAKVMMCNKLQPKISLYFMRYGGFSSLNTEVYSNGSLYFPIRFFDAFPSQHQWINQIKNSQKRNDTIKLESKKELLVFLEISIDSTMMMLKVKHDSSLSPSENWDSYLIGLNLPEYDIEKVNEPFIPKFPN
jgi:hypothetical protein